MRLFERALKAGIPFTPAQAPWWDLAGPVRDYLAALAPVRMDAMSRAAEVYRSRGELGPAFELLLASGDANQAAAVLGATSGPEEDKMDNFELQARFDQLPAEAVDAHPEVLVMAGRRLGHSSKYNLCCQLLDHAQEIATRRRRRGPVPRRPAPSWRRSGSWRRWITPGPKSRLARCWCRRGRTNN